MYQNNLSSFTRFLVKVLIILTVVTCLFLCLDYGWDYDSYYAYKSPTIAVIGDSIVKYILPCILLAIYASKGNRRVSVDDVIMAGFFAVFLRSFDSSWYLDFDTIENILEWYRGIELWRQLAQIVLYPLATILGIIAVWFVATKSYRNYEKVGLIKAPIIMMEILCFLDLYNYFSWWNDVAEEARLFLMGRGIVPTLAVLCICIITLSLIKSVAGDPILILEDDSAI